MLGLQEPNLYQEATMREAWIEIIRVHMEPVEGQLGVFRNRAATREHPFSIEYTMRVLLGAGEFAPYVAGEHQHPVFDKSIPSGGDILLDTNRAHFLVVKLQSHDVSGTQPHQNLTTKNHTHYIPWAKIIDLEFTEVKTSQPGAA
jgi:hypothetical protein